MGIQTWLNEMDARDNDFVSIRELVSGLAQSEEVTIQDAAWWLLHRVLESTNRPSPNRPPRALSRDPLTWEISNISTHQVWEEDGWVWKLEHRLEAIAVDDDSEYPLDDEAVSDDEAASDGEAVSDGEAASDDEADEADEDEADHEAGGWCEDDKRLGWYKTEIAEFLEAEGVKPPECCHTCEGGTRTKRPSPTGHTRTKRPSPAGANAFSVILAAFCQMGGIDITKHGIATRASKVTELMGAPVSDKVIGSVIAGIPDAVETRRQKALRGEEPELWANVASTQSELEEVQSELKKVQSELKSPNPTLALQIRTEKSPNPK